MDENPTDVQAPEITPADFDGDQVIPKAESSPVADKTESKEAAKSDKAPEGDKSPDVVEKPKEEAKADSEAETEDKAEKSDKVDETDKTTESDKTPAPKSENRYRNLANENRELRRQVETLTSQAYQPATEEELTGEVNPETGENYNRLEAKFEAYRQSQELEKYTSQVVGAQAEIGNEAASVMNDFPIFNPSSDSFDEELALEAAQLLEPNLIRDPNIPEMNPETGKPTGRGIVIGSNVSTYQLYKTLARASGISSTKGQIKGQAAAERQLANVDANSSSAPPKKAEDPLSKLWEGDL